MAAPLNQNVNITIRFENQKAVTNIKTLNVNMRGLSNSIQKQTTTYKKQRVAMKQVNDEAFKFRVATPKMRRNIGALRNEILLLVFAFGGIVAAMKGAIDASVKLESAMLGLGAVASKVGESRFKAMAAASKLAASGLISITDASAGLKNLMSTGNFTLQKSVDIMKALADSAAFNRQGTLSYGEAIVGATQGIKNQNCLSYYNTILYVEEDEENKDSSCIDGIKLVSSPIGELHDSGKVPTVFSVDRDTGKVVTLQSSYIHYNGEREVYKIKLENGSEVEATANHRFLTTDGFKFLCDLEENEEIYWVDESGLKEKICELLIMEKESVRDVDVCTDPQIQHNKYAESVCKSSVLSVEEFLELSLEKDLGQQNSVPENVKENGIVKTKKEETQQIIERGSILKKFGLDVKSAEKILNHLESMSIKDLEEFVLMNADQLPNQMQGKKALAKTSGTMLHLLKTRVIGAENQLQTHLGELKKDDFVQINVEQNGNSQQLKDGQQNNTLLLMEKHQKVKNMQKTTTIGEQQSFQGIPFDVHDVVEMVKEVLRLIIYSVEQNSQSYHSSYQMVSPSAQTATEKSTKKVNKILSKLKISPILIKIVSISYQGIKATYDLTVPDDHNYLTRGSVTHNSIMVDNAGITKNLSIMYKEYAAAIGTTAGVLTDAQKFQAIYNGLLREASIFAGNAALVTETLAGAQAKLGVTLFELKATFGEIISKGYQASLKAIQKLTETTKKYFNANRDMLKQKVEKGIKAVAGAIVALTKAFIFFTKPLQIGIKLLGRFTKEIIALFVISKLAKLIGFFAGKLVILGTVLSIAVKKMIIFRGILLATAGVGKLTATLTAISTRLILLGKHLPIVGGMFTALSVKMTLFNRTLLSTGSIMASLKVALAGLAPVLFAVGAAISILTILWIKHKQNAKSSILDVLAVEKEAIKTHRNHVEIMRDLSAEVVKLADKYKDLSEDSKNAKKNEQELKRVEEEIKRILPTLNIETGNYAVNLDKVAKAAGDAFIELDKMNRQMVRSDIDKTLNSIATVTFKLTNALEDNLTPAFRKFVKGFGGLLMTSDATRDVAKALGKDGFGGSVKITENNVVSLSEKLKGLRDGLRDQALGAKRGSDEYNEYFKAFDKVDNFMKNHVDTIMNQVKAQDMLKERLLELQTVFTATEHVNAKMVSNVKKEVDEMLKLFDPKSVVKITHGVGGLRMPDIILPLEEAKKRIEAITKRFGDKITFKIGIETIGRGDIDDLIEDLNKEIAKTRGIDISKMFGDFTAKLEKAGVGVERIKESTEAIKTTLRGIKKEYEDTLTIRQEQLKILQEELKDNTKLKGVVGEAREKINQLAGDAARIKQEKLDKYFESMSKSAKSTQETIERLLDRIERFINKGKKAGAEGSVSFLDRIFGGDRAGKEDAINRAKTTLRTLERDILDHYVVLGVLTQEGREKLKAIHESYRNIEKNENRKFNEERIENTRIFIESLVTSFSQLGEFLAERGAGVNAERDKRLKETEKLYRDEVISFQEKEDQIRRIEQASREERLKLEQRFWNNTINIISKAISEILIKIATAEIAKKGLMGAGLGPLGLIAGGIGLIALSGYLTKNREIASQDTGFAGLDSAERAGAGGKDQSRLTGVIQARELQIIISPSIQITGEVILIGAIGVEELQTTIGDVAVQSIKNAIENREISLGDIPSVG